MTGYDVAPEPVVSRVRLAVLATVVALLGAWVYGSIDWTTFATLVTRKSALTGREELSRVYVARRSTIETRRAELARLLRSHSAYHVVPADGVISWASPLLTRQAGVAGMTISTMLPLSGRPAPWTEDPLTPRVLDSVSIRLDLEGTEQQFSRFLSLLEEENPYLCVTSVTMLDGRGEPTRRITTVIEWPVWGQGARSAYVQKLLQVIP